MNGRSILAVLAGILSGGFAIYLIQGLLGRIFPIDHEALLMSMKSPAAFKEFMLNQPLSAHLSIIVSHGLGLLAGLIVGRLIDRHNAMTLIAISCILLLGNVLNFIAVPHPTWFPFVDVLFTLAVAIGYIFTRKNP